MVIRGIDVGRSRVKGFDGEVFDTFPSFVGESRLLKNGYVFKPDDNLLVRHMKEKDKELSIATFVGGVAGIESEYGTKFMSITKVHSDTQILAITSLARTVTNGEEIFVVLAQPIDRHVKTEKEALKNLILGDYDVTINGTRKKFSVKRAIVGAEGAIAVFGMDEVPDGIHHVIDIGSSTFNVATFKKKNWIDLKSFTEDLGVETMNNYHPQSMARLIAAKFFTKIRKQMGRITFIGGSAKEIEPYLNQYLRDITVPDDHDVFTAKSLYRFGEEVLKEDVS